MSAAPLTFRLRPSAADRWFACPGSARAEDEAPERTSSAAELGTAAHELGELALRLELDAADLIGTKLNDDQFTADEDMAEAVQVYLDTVRGDMLLDPGELRIETKVDLGSVVPGFSGTSDVSLLSPGILRVYDYKNGFVYVHEDGRQLKTYAAGLMLDLIAAHEAGDAPVPPAEVELVIVQPRCDSAEPVRRHLLATDDLLKWIDDELRPAALAAAAPDAPRVPSKSACHWCDAKGGCPEFGEAALESAQEVFAVAREEPHLKLDEIKPGRVVTRLSPEQLGAVLDAAPLLEEFIAAAHTFAKAQVERGVDVPGYKLVEKFGNRTWKGDETKTVAGLKAAGLDNPYKPKLMSPAQAEKAGAPKAEVAKLAHKPSKGTSIAPDADKRPDVSRTAADVFDVIDTTAVVKS